MATNEGRVRLKQIIADSEATVYMTTGGVVKSKTAKRREIEYAVMQEVIRFAFDHGGYRGEHLGPTGLMMELRDEVREEIRTKKRHGLST